MDVLLSGATSRKQKPYPSQQPSEMKGGMATNTDDWTATGTGLGFKKELTTCNMVTLIWKGRKKEWRME